MSNLKNFSKLKFVKSILRLKQIVKLKTKDVDEHVDFFQLVVCDDQFAEKSSILESITSFSFSRQDEICIKFFTKIIFRHSDDERVILTIILSTIFRTKQIKKNLQSYKRHLENFDEFNSEIDRNFFLRNINKQQKKNSRDCARTKSNNS